MHTAISMTLADARSMALAAAAAGAAMPAKESAARTLYASFFIDDFNRRFAKPPRNDWDAHRPVREDEDLGLIFTHREKRQVTHALTLQYDKTMFLIEDT